MFDSASRIVEAAENRISQLRDSIATQTAEVETLQGVIAAAQRGCLGIEAAKNGHAEPSHAEPSHAEPSRKRGRPKKTETSEPKVWRLGISADVSSYLMDVAEATVDRIAEKVNCTKQQVSQALTQGKKRGRFKNVSRGVWALA